MKRQGEQEYFIGRRYGDFQKMYKNLRTELPGKVLPSMPRKNKTSSRASGLLSGWGKDDDASSVSSVSTMGTMQTDTASSLKNLTIKDHRRSGSANSFRTSSPRPSTDGQRPSVDQGQDGTVLLFRETQRISLRAFLRTLLQQPQVATTAAIREFLTLQPINLTDENVIDIERRKAMDEKRLEEQKQFYEIARKRAADLDVYMEQ